MEYIYPAIFEQNSDGSYTVTYPDLLGCISEGKSLANAMSMAEDALSQWLDYLIDKQLEVPDASHISSVVCGENEFVSLVKATKLGEIAIDRIVSLPKWLDDKSAQAGLVLSHVLQEALVERFAP